jgi:excisionase family DNA binding protein
MKYWIRAIRVETAEKVVSATDEENAIRKVQEDLGRPYGFLGRWETKALELEVVSAESRLGVAPDGVPAEGPLLLSVSAAGKPVGFSSRTMYELISAGEIEHVRVGRRVLVARSAITKFIEVNSRSGYYS